VKEKKKAPMADVKLNPDSDEVGIKFKIIGISVTIGLNAIVFIWYFFFSGLT
tara:strand:+ start:614 stop:769 length:156 start_codon:yes stop_codon:yes gene_type:complete